MESTKKIKSALVSVYHKDGLEEILKLLNDNGVRLFSTGGTHKFIEGLGYECETVESITGYPSILGGRVKTLHPSVFGGILCRRDNASDMEQTAKYSIPEIDLVIVDLYPFADTVASGSSEADIIAMRLADDGKMHLRYGENPHQKACFYGDFNKVFDKLHGKEISYNNLLDIDAAVSLIADFDTPTFAILKHNNACGIASCESIMQAWETALACDPVSAFGGVLIANRDIDAATAEKINSIFFEVIIAPAYSEDALKALKTKKNRIILVQKCAVDNKYRYRSAVNGVLCQEKDAKVETLADLRQVCKRAATERECADMLFALKVVKHSKSNSIVLAKDGRLLASGVGQTSRVDALKQAIEKARSFGFDLTDAFFPFADCVEIAHESGITAVVHPGGSIRDNESVEYCDAHDMAMAMTGFRHFRH